MAILDIQCRKESLLTGKSTLETLFCLEKFPVHMGVTEEQEDKDVFSDMTFDIDVETGMIQIRELIPQSVLYRDAHYNNIAGSWKKHHEAFAELISRYPVNNIFEIGGGTGLLAKCYQDRYNANWTILEAVPNPVEGCKAKFESGFFDEKYVIPAGHDAVVHTHCMEHFFEPIEYLQAISDNMQEGSYLFISIPNMQEMYNRHFTNILNFEHTYFCEEPYVSYMLMECGYKVLQRENFLDDHSVFYVAQKVAQLCPCVMENNYVKNKEMFNSWVIYHQQLINQINRELDKIDGDKQVYLFGAHAYAQFLLAFGLKSDNIVCVLDNDPVKQGKRLCGTHFQVLSPKKLKDDKRPVVILHAGTHNEEIKRDILGNINTKAVFI